MEIRSEIVAEAMKQFVDEMFAKTELNLRNAINAIGAKMMMHNKFAQFLPMIANEQGLIDIDFLEATVNEQMKKLGSFIIPAIGTSYKLTEADVQNLFAKIRAMEGTQNEI